MAAHEVIAAEILAMASYGPRIKTGEFLLPSGLMPVGRDGHVTGKDISPGFPGLSHAGYIQAATVHDYAEALCKAAGTSLAQMQRAQYFVPDLTTFPGIAMAWTSRFGVQPLPFACIQTPPAMPAPGMALIADFWISTL
jgi:enamine deaminase RidA (YjgF/YER057c/UK114 family)